MKTLILSAALVAAAFAAPATAQVTAGSAAAIAHFNQDADGQDDRRLLKSDDTGVTVSTRSGNSGFAFDLFNAQADSQDGIRGLNGATSYGGQPTIAADIFADIRAASAEDE